MTQDLSHFHILNTRPSHQASGLTQQLRQQNAHVTELPAIEIVHSTTSDERQKAYQIDLYDCIIFVSMNAAKGVESYWKPTHSPVLCIGPVTAQYVSNFQTVTAVANPPSSFGLLELPHLQNINNKNILIVCGSHHNPKIKQTLKVRNARVDTLVSYSTRTLTHITAKHLASIQQSTTNLIITTSIHGLEQLHTWFHQDKHWLITKNLLVVSEKMRHRALKLGWNTDNILVSPEATDQSIVATLKQKA